MLGAMQDAQSFIARLDATVAILDVVTGRAEFDQVVENETGELLSMLDLVSVRGQDAATFIKAVKAAKLPPATEETVISRVVQLLSTPHKIPPASSGSGPLAGRGGAHNVGVVYQVFTSIVEYIPEKVWRHCAATRCGISII